MWILTDPRYRVNLFDTKYHLSNLLAFSNETRCPIIVHNSISLIWNNISKREILKRKYNIYKELSPGALCVDISTTTVNVLTALKQSDSLIRIISATPALSKTDHRQRPRKALNFHECFTKRASVILVKYPAVCISSSHCPAQLPDFLSTWLSNLCNPRYA